MKKIQENCMIGSNTKRGRKIKRTIVGQIEARIWRTSLKIWRKWHSKQRKPRAEFMVDLCLSFETNKRRRRTVVVIMTVIRLCFEGVLCARCIWKVGESPCCRYMEALWARFLSHVRSDRMGSDSALSAPWACLLLIHKIKVTRVSTTHSVSHLLTH